MTAQQLRFKSAKTDSDKDVITCPFCRFDFTHIETVKTVPGNDDYDAGWWGRGDLLVVSMYCESGHTWELCIGQHKGQSYIFCRPDPNWKSTKKTTATP